MTTPAPAAATPAAGKTATAPPPASGTLTDALSAAITAIAVHITGRTAGSEHDALVALGLTSEQASAITGTPGA
jgi:hypothetical protein